MFNAHENEIVTVALRRGEVKGVVYAVDPEDGWVSVVTETESGVKRLMIVRPTIVEYSGCKSEKTVDLGTVNVSTKAMNLSGTELMAELKKRGVEGVIDSATNKVILFDGLVTISEPYESANIETTNSTIQNRVTKVLEEVRETLRSSTRNTESG